MGYAGHLGNAYVVDVRFRTGVLNVFVLINLHCILDWSEFNLRFVISKGHSNADLSRILCTSNTMLKFEDLDIFRPTLDP